MKAEREPFTMSQVRDVPMCQDTARMSSLLCESQRLRVCDGPIVE
jgi:hypothetical protein